MINLSDLSQNKKNLIVAELGQVSNKYTGHLVPLTIHMSRARGLTGTK